MPKPLLRIAGREFRTRAELHAYLDTVRTAPPDKFDVLANSPAVSDILTAMMTVRPRKRHELGDREVLRWTRKKLGPHWAFHAVLSDESLLDMGVSKPDVSEFWREWLVRSPQA